MCHFPILIPNPNYRSNEYRKKFDSIISPLARFKDTTSQFIAVPCGYCSACLQLKQQYLIQRVQMESLSNDLYFGTLTYNNDSLRHLSVGDFTFSYVDITDWQKMLKHIRLKENLPSFKYFFVTEYGGRRHRPHIHFLLSFTKDDRQTLADKCSFQILLHDIFLKYWRRNYGSDRCPIWKPLCTYVRTRNSYNFDLHYLDPWSTSEGVNSVAFYVSKYCLKYDRWLDRLKSRLYFTLSESDYKDVWSKLRPRRLLSKGFGSPSDPKVIEHIKKSIKVSLLDTTCKFASFISPVDGKLYPMSPYYSKRFLTFDDLEVFLSRRDLLTDYDAMTLNDDVVVSDVLNSEQRFNKIRQDLDSKHTFFDDDADDVNFVNFSKFYDNAKAFRLSSFTDDFDVSDDF